MHARQAGLLLLSLAACAQTASSLPPSLPGPGVVPAPPPSRLFLGPPEDAFWVAHGPGIDRVIVGGGRVELGTSGEVSAAVWDLEQERRTDGLLGALALPRPARRRVRPLEQEPALPLARVHGHAQPIATGRDGLTIHGVRAGLRAVGRVH